MISRFFIARPVLANVLAIIIVVLGIVSLSSLPVAQYPNVVPPTVQVTTRYPGASAETLINTVALPIEQQVNGVENMLYMQSTSASDGSYTLLVTFEIGTDTDFAQVLVQNRVAAALAQLPEAVQSQGVTTQKKSTSILEIVTLSSEDNRYDGLYLSNYATINLVNALSRLPGVGQVNVFGAGEYAMRIWLDPDALQSRGLTPTDVITSIKQQSQEVAAGQVGMPPTPVGQDFQYTVNVQGRLDEVDEFSNIVVKVEQGGGGRVTRVRDVARVELGSQTYGQTFKLDNNPSTGIGIYQLPGANALDVAKAVDAEMANLAKAFPPGMVYKVPFNTTTFVNASINEVWKTLIEAGVLILIVILVFLQDWRATLVPATTVPVTIIGAFAAMAAMGFGINLSTLFAIILAIGIVVDDAIVIVEGAARHIEAGLSGPEAAGKAMDELFAPVMGITLVLMAVFVPAAFLPGLTGQMYRQFALVIAATALISAINAVTLKPTQCALWLRPTVPREKRNFFYRGFNRVFDVAEGWYTRLIGAMVRRSGAMVVLALILIGIAGYGMVRIPTAFIPIEDQGYMIAAVQLPDGASLERTQAMLEQVTEIAKKVPGVDQVIAINGISVLDNSATLANAGVGYIMLKDWSVRGKAEGLLPIYKSLNEAFAGIEGASIIVLPPPPIQGIGNAGGFTMQTEIRDGNFDYPKLQAMTEAVIANASTQSAIARTMTTFRASVPQVMVDVDRIKAESLKVSVGDVFSAMSSYLGSSYVNQFDKFGHTFQVYVQAESDFRLRPEDIASLKVKNRDGDMIPIGTMVTIKSVAGPSLISLYNLYPSASIIGSPAQGFSSGQALDLMDQNAASTLPPGAGAEWTAMSYQEKQVGNQILYVFALAILLVYLVLAGQYESWLAPISVILAVPLALSGPAIALTLLGVASNLYVQIGLILLIALASKNAILIVEYARDVRHNEHKSIVDSAIEAARLRFRPILMTSFAFILGVVPLVTATGAGANARISLGLTVFSGMIASTCLAVLFVPSFFAVMQRFEERRLLKSEPKPEPTPDPEPTVAN